MENVTATTDEPVPFPGVVRQFEGAGCRLLGRLRDGRASRPPLALLSAPDAEAFISVDTLAAQPVVRLRTLLTDGTLLETVQRDRVPPTQPDPDQPAGLDATRSARRRVVRVAPFWDSRESLQRHAALVAAHARRGSAVPCDDLALAVRLFGAAEAHSRAVDAHGLRLVSETRTWLLAGAAVVAMALALVVVNVTGSLLWALVVGAVTMLVAWTASGRVTALLFGVRRLRPPFTL